jgi:hypothetical protein
VSPRPHALFAATVLCVLTVASCGGESKTQSATTSTTGTTSKSAVTPVLGQSVVLTPVSGSVRVKLPSTSSFVSLELVRSVQLGTVIDAHGGIVKLTAASPTPGKSAVGDFQDGEFEVLQSSDGVVDLKIQNTLSEKTTCSGSNGSRQLNTRLLGLLLGNGTGKFRTEGEFAAASVLGTDWGVRNRCDGTLTIVRRGTVEVTDFRLHKTVVLHTGQTYLATAS